MLELPQEGVRKEVGYKKEIGSDHQKILHNLKPNPQRKTEEVLDSPKFLLSGVQEEMSFGFGVKAAAMS